MRPLRLSSAARATIAILAAGLGSLVVLGCGEPPPPRVVLITAATLPAGDPTALLGRHAAEAVRFEGFHAASPWTAPSVASMLTGRHPWDHRVLRPGDPLPVDTATVAGALSARSFATAAAVSRDRTIGAGFTRGFGRVVRSDDPAGAALGLLDRLAEDDPPGQLLWVHLGHGAADLRPLLDRLDADAGRFESHVVLAAATAAPNPSGGDPVRAPLYLLSPRLDPSDERTRRDVAGSVDVARTLLSLAGVKYPPAPWSNGRDLSVWAPDPALDPSAASGARAAALGMLPPRSGQAGRPLFYAVDRSGGFYAGNASGLVTAPDDARRDALDQVSTLFRGLERRVTRPGRRQPATSRSEPSATSRSEPSATSRSRSPPAPTPPAPPPPPAAGPAPP